jgi:hypothetical protein
MASTSHLVRVAVPDAGTALFAMSSGNAAPAMYEQFVTAEHGVTYRSTFARGTYRVERTRGGDGRMVFWPTGTPPAPAAEVRSTWTASIGQVAQPGHAHRVTVDRDGVHAITVTRNIWLGARWIVNVHAWRDGVPHLLAQVDLPRLRTAHFPWHVASRVFGPVVEVKVWPAGTHEPAWGAAGAGIVAFIPSWYGIATSGQHGWYAGHLTGPAAAIAYRDLTVRALS